MEPSNNSPNRRSQQNQNTFINNHIYSVLLSFLPVASVFFFYLVINGILYKLDTHLNSFFYSFIIMGLFFIANVAAFITLSSIMLISVYWRSALLANTFLFGFMLANQLKFEGLICFGYYLMTLSFFHLSEFVFTALFNHQQISTDSFLLNHSVEYGLAAVASWLEFFIELLIIPSMKKSLLFRFIGLSLILFGELFRKLAMYTAGKSFNHHVQESRSNEHVLVTSGIYSLIRHPSYFGWFYWSIGTQILLANPICAIVYTIASWKFFQSRILYEEFYLIKFFGKEYKNYQQKVMSGIPFVKGYIIPDESLD